MAESLFSPSWYRVSQLKPRLRGHAKVHRHSYRDEVWFVLQDHLSGKFHRFSEGANHVIGLMNGQRTVDQIWQLAADELADDSPTQEQMIRLLAQLHSADVLQSEIPPDSAEIFKRHQRQEKAQLKQKLWSPLSLRFSLFDPDRFLVKCLPVVRPLFGITGFFIWLAVVLAGLILAGMHWSELSNNITDRALAPQNLLLIWLIYPVVKSIHELGHAFATRVWGGEVHDIGLMFLVFMPVPYVDASAASAFRQKNRRMIVGAIGIMVELFLAAIALFIWINAEYSVVRAVAYNVMLIGGVSTVFFNGNPLLRFDGYYVFSDYLEIPNLAKRSQSYLAYLCQRYLFNMREVESPAATSSERKWFLFYGTTSFMYRMFIAVAIILFVAGEFFIFGILLAIWATFTMLALPLLKLIKFLFSSPKLTNYRVRAMWVSSLLIGVLCTLIFVVPAPYRTMAEGVVWLPERSAIRAGTDCFLDKLTLPTGSFVRKDALLISCDDPLLRARADNLNARHRELKALLAAQWQHDRVAARITREEIRAVEADRLDIGRRLDALSIISPTTGTLIVPLAANLPGRYATQGEILGYVFEQTSMTVRVVVPEGDSELVAGHTQAIHVQLADKPNLSLPARMTRKVPGGSNTLPSSVLGKGGGGSIDVDPRDPKHTQTFSKVFQYELTLPETVAQSPAGTRVYVRFDHGEEPLGYQWFRQARQVFLGKFGV